MRVNDDVKYKGKLGRVKSFKKIVLPDGMKPYILVKVEFRDREFEWINKIYLRVVGGK